MTGCMKEKEIGEKGAMYLLLLRSSSVKCLPGSHTAGIGKETEREQCFVRNALPRCLLTSRVLIPDA